MILRLALATGLLMTVMNGPVRGEEAPAADPAAELQVRSYAIAPISDSVVAAGTTYGVVFYNTGKPRKGTREPVSVGQPIFAIPLPDSVNDLLYSGGILAVANGPRGVKLFKSKPGEALPVTRVGDIETGGAAMSIASIDNLLFVAEGTLGVAGYDLSKPELPERVFQLDTGGYARDVLAVQLDDEAIGIWVAAGRGGLVQTRIHPTRFDSLSSAGLVTEGEVRRVTMVGRDIVFSRGKMGVCRVHQDMRLIDMVCIPCKDIARTLTVDGNIVWVGDGGEGIFKVDWKNYTSPKETLRVPLQRGSVNNISWFGKRLWIAADYGGVLYLLP